MDGSRNGRRLRESCMRRQFEWNRLEEAVWAMAYEEVWPIVRRALQSGSSKPSMVEEGGVKPTARVAAGA